MSLKFTLNTFFLLIIDFIIQAKNPVLIFSVFLLRIILSNRKFL